jgi:RimJ/RimL family protein N-acetyltransferase
LIRSYHTDPVRCVEDADPDTFGDRLRPLFVAEPIFTNVIATVLAAPPRSAHWLRVLDEDELAGAAIWVPPRGVHLSPMPPPAARALADHLVMGEHRLPGVDGPSRAAAAFARRYASATGGSVALGLASRLYRLDRVTRPAAVTGRQRPAVAADRPLILDWLAAFAAEATPGHPLEDQGPVVDSRLAAGQLMWFWEVAGEPVSFCWYTPVSPTLRVTRVSAVYTPPALRGHGYASANVAAASQQALEGGATTCMLYTDRGNPTSNRIYQGIGYRPVGDAQEWLFT